MHKEVQFQTLGERQLWAMVWEPKSTGPTEI